MNQHLAKFEAMSHTGPLYGCLKGNHFVEGQKLILEGNRSFRDQSDGRRFQLMDEATSPVLLATSPPEDEEKDDEKYGYQPQEEEPDENPPVESGGYENPPPLA